MDAVALALDVEREPRGLALDVGHHVVVDGFLGVGGKGDVNGEDAVGGDRAGHGLEGERLWVAPVGKDPAALVKVERERRVLVVGERHNLAVLGPGENLAKVHR